MASIKTQILEKTPEGEFHLTEQGEFLAYFDAHLHLFEQFLKSKHLAADKFTEAYEGIKKYMETNTKTTENFFEQMESYSTYLHTTKEALTEYLTSSFMEILVKSQEKIKNQELDRLESGDSFSSIMEEILFKIGQIFPSTSQFTFKDDLLVIHDKSKGIFIKPVGLLIETKIEQEKVEAEKTQTKQAPPTTPIAEKKPVKEEPTPPVQTVVTFIPENSLLKEILELSETHFTGKKLDVKAGGTETEDSDEVSNNLSPYSEEIKNENSSENSNDSLDPDDEDQIHQNIESESTIESEIDYSNNQDIEVENDELTPPDLDDIQEEESSIPDMDDLNLDESFTPVVEEDENSLMESEDTKVILDMEPDPGNIETPKENKQSKNSVQKPKLEENKELFNNFKYSDYISIYKEVEKIKLNKEEYNKWLSTSSTLVKTLISIQVNIAQEAGGGRVNWTDYYKKISTVTGLEINEVENFKRLVQKLNLTKKCIELLIKNFKKQNAEVTKILKTGWPHISDAFGSSPDLNLVRQRLEKIYSVIKDSKVRKMIESTISEGINNLEDYCKSLS